MNEGLRGERTLHVTKQKRLRNKPATLQHEWMRKKSGLRRGSQTDRESSAKVTCDLVAHVRRTHFYFKGKGESLTMGFRQRNWRFLPICKGSLCQLYKNELKLK